MKLPFRYEKPIRVASRVSIEKKQSKTGVVMELLLLFFGLLGYLFCNETALKMAIPAPVVILIAVAAFGLMLLITLYRRIFFSVAGGLAVLGLIAFPLTRVLLRYIAYSLEVCYNVTVYLLGTQEKYTSYLNKMTLDISVIEDRASLTPYFYTALIVLALLCALFFALAFYKRIPVIASFIVPSVALIPLFYYGVVPHFAAFSLFLSAAIGCYGQSVVQRVLTKNERKEKRAKKAAGARIRRKAQSREERFSFAGRFGNFGMVVMAVMVFLTMGIAAFIYTRPLLQLDAVRNKIDSIATQTMNALFRTTYEKQLHVAGFMEEDETTLSLMPPSWRDLLVAQVATDTSRPVYLRYLPTVDLEESGWTVADPAFEEDYSNTVGTRFCEFNQYYQFLKLTAEDGDPLTAGLDDVHSVDQGYVNEEITVYPYYKVSKLLGLPYGAVSQAPLSDYADLERENDTVVWHNDSPRDGSYMYRVASPDLSSETFMKKFDATLQAYRSIRASHGKNDEYLSLEDEYGNLVYRRYLTVPEDLKYSIYDLTHEITASYPTPLEKTLAVQRYLRNNYSYSTTRQHLETVDEKGARHSARAEDYVRYFLLNNEKKEGYCTLFASAMVCMLRELYIPARVVTGYYTDVHWIPEGGCAGYIRDWNYHAWVEVYFDGAGWIPFDPTPGFGTEPSYCLLDLVDQNRSDEIASEVEIEYYVDPDFVYYRRTLPDPTGAEEEHPITPPIREMVKNLRTRKMILKIVITVFLILLLLFGIWFGSVLWHRRCLKKASKGSPGAGALRACRMVLRLMQLRGFCFFEGELWEDFARRADNLKITPEPLLPMTRLLQKTLFANDSVTEEERADLVFFLRIFDHEEFRRANIFKAIWYRYTFHWKPRRKSLIWRFR